MAELAIEMKKRTFQFSDLQKVTYHIRVDTPETQEQSPTLKSDPTKNNSRWTHPGCKERCGLEMF